MKNNIQIKIKGFLIMLLYCLNANAQSTISGSGTTGHNAGSGPASSYYVGWDNNTTIPLEIRHDNTGSNAQDIDFYTNSAQKMTIKGTNGSDNGFVGIGLTSPQNLLHIDAGTMQITNSTTGATGGDGFLIGQASSGSTTVEINNQENGPMKFFTNGTPRVFIDNNGGGGNVGIGTSFITPASRLHIKEGSGNNAWFQITGNNTGDASTDGFRVGVTNSSTATAQSVEIRQQENADMNFFTNGNNQRMTIKADGKVGIATTGPNRLFEVLDANNPQMRLSYASTVYSDFQTNSSGNLYIHPVTSTGAEGNVGIGTASPGARLHVTSANNTSSSVDGSRITFTNTGSNPGNTLDAGLNLTSIITAVDVNNGIYSTVNGGNTCNAYSAKVDNTNTASALNTGYYSNVIDGSSGTPTNLGFFAEILPSTSISSVNKGFRSYLGTAGASHFPGTEIGLDITSYNAQSNTGVLVNLFSTNTSNSTATYYGIYSLSSADASNHGVANNYGGYFKAEYGTTLNYGVYATGGTSCTSSPTPGNCPNAAGYFSGAVGVTDHLYDASDIFLKDNIQPISDASVIINQLNPKTYTFKTQQYPSMHLPDSTQFGLIAEEVEQVLPELVRNFTEPEVNDSLGNIVYEKVNFKALNYTSLIPILIAGFKEQQAQIAALTDQVNGCCAQPRTNGDAGTNKSSIELENIASLILFQADPNPFSESTTIRFNIPTDFNNAVIYFYDNSGNRINTYEIKDKGQGELQVFGSKLSSGIYTYTLVIDGKVIDSKKMLKSK